MNSDKPIAKTIYGPVQGEIINGVTKFAGIQFGDHISGDARFLPPRAPSSWTDVRILRCNAPRSPQPRESVNEVAPACREFFFGPRTDEPISEEGLFLNIWTPSVDPGAKRPVMVWLHGGGFTTGCPSGAREDGTKLARNGEVVVVAPSHRLGAHGYLYLNEPGPFQNRSANLGMQDIVFALRWVAENIEEFGGDPANVTVFGESGGAMKVSTLLAMPSARGLLHRAICQAGPFAPGFRYLTMSRPEADSMSRRFLSSAGCKDIDELLTLTTREFVEALQDTWEGIMAWRPVADGIVLPKSAEDALLDGSTLDVPMFIGLTANEADYDVRFDMNFGTRDELRKSLGQHTDRIFEGYRKTRPDADQAAIYRAIWTDWTFRMGSIQVAELRSSLKSNTFMYSLDWQRNSEPKAKVTHGSEALFIFGTLDHAGFTRNDDEARRLSEEMQGAWLAFARTGDPSHSGIPQVPPYNGATRSTIVFATDTRIEHDPQHDDRLVWEREWNSKTAFFGRYQAAIKSL
ncbi:carboxylesterase family protein [Phyllobacterium sp. YR531]|uniref:carboxylesterase/lipase family protein n=1 Tax=Phyllobacterium sp. YR531 TaxID=1144343 RepID=UPI00026FB1C6|nr:carboxylesterase family protein [Phyllobacterium sp. YR531]EJN06723.1 carboxylesterase type B [Phyllobacterium sp. YR531]